MENINNCMLAGICGGCKHTAVSYDEQLKLKNDFVKSLLDSAVDYDYEYEGIIKSPLIFAYRNKMEYSFGDEKKDGPLTLGLHKKRSYYDVINCDSCLLVHDDFNKIVRATREYFAELGVTYKDKRSHKGYLRHLLIRRAVNTGDILIDLVTTGESPKRVEKHSDINAPDKIIEIYDARETVNKWAEIIKGIELTGNIRGILNTINDSMADAIKNDRTDIIYGEDHIYEEILGLRFKITPFSFFQTNSKGAEVLYKKAREYVLWNGSDSEAERLSDSSEGTPEEKLSDKVVYDLYSGTGTIAQVLSPSAKEVIGVEIVEEAVEAARENENLYAIGVDSDQDYIAEGKVLTSVVKNCGNIAYEMIESVLNGTFETGDKVYDLENGGVSLTDMTYTKDLIGEDTIAMLDDLRQQIIDGEIVVTDLFEQ